MTAEQKERVKAIRSHARRLAEVTDHTRALVARQLVELCDALLVVEPEPRKNPCDCGARPDRPHTHGGPSQEGGQWRPTGTLSLTLPSNRPGRINDQKN